MTSVLLLLDTQGTMTTSQFLLFQCVVYGVLGVFMVLLYRGKHIRRWWQRKRIERKSIDMGVIQGTTWDIEVGINPNADRFRGFDRTESFRLFADTHDKAAAILRKYRPDLNLDNIIKSERSMLSVIVDFPKADGQ